MLPELTDLKWQSDSTGNLLVNNNYQQESRCQTSRGRNRVPYKTFEDLSVSYGITNVSIQEAQSESPPKFQQIKIDLPLKPNKKSVEQIALVSPSGLTSALRQITENSTWSESQYSEFSAIYNPVLTLFQQNIQDQENQQGQQNQMKITPQGLVEFDMQKQCNDQALKIENQRVFSPPKNILQEQKKPKLTPKVTPKAKAFNECRVKVNGPILSTKNYDETKNYNYAKNKPQFLKKELKANKICIPSPINSPTFEQNYSPPRNTVVGSDSEDILSYDNVYMEQMLPTLVQIHISNQENHVNVNRKLNKKGKAQKYDFQQRESLSKSPLNEQSTQCNFPSIKTIEKSKQELSPLPGRNFNVPIPNKLEEDERKRSLSNLQQNFKKQVEAFHHKQFSSMMKIKNSDIVAKYHVRPNRNYHSTERQAIERKMEHEFSTILEEQIGINSELYQQRVGEKTEELRKLLNNAALKKHVQKKGPLAVLAKPIVQRKWKSEQKLF